MEPIGARLYSQAMTDDAELLQRLAAYIERRIAELGLEYAEVARLAEFSIEVLRKMRHGISVRPSTYRKLERALKWEHGSVAAILEGGEPTPLDETQGAEQRPQEAAPQSEQGLSPREALRRVVRSSARELGVKADALGDVFRAVQQDLGEAGRTDLSDLVRLGRAEAGLSLEAVAAATVDPSTGERLVEADWLDRLERAALHLGEEPEYEQLDALIPVLHLDITQVRDAAGVQFLDTHAAWAADGQAVGLVEGELSAEDNAKMQELMRLYRKAPQRRDG